MTEIQKHIVERGKRNALSRRYHAKDDKEAIATWGLEFNRILHVFHVCPIASAWRLLTFSFQTELWTNVRTTDSGIHQGVKSKHTVIPDAHRGTPNAETTVSYARHDVSYVHPIVSDTRGDVAITRTTVSAIHHDKLKGRENADAQNQAVGTTHTVPVTNRPILTIPQPHARSVISAVLEFAIQYLLSARLENCLPRNGETRAEPLPTFVGTFLRSKLWFPTFVIC